MYSIVSEESGLLPRERLLQKGAEVLSDQELLAIVLRTGTKSESVLSMANRIMKGMTSLADLSRLSLNELQEIPGIGRVKSIELKAMVELAKRIEKAELARSEQIMSSQQVARRMMLDIGDKSGASGGYLFGYAEPYYSAKRRSLLVGSVVRLLSHVRFYIMPVI